MATLLHINVSPRGNYSISRQLGSAAVQAWKEGNPGGHVIVRDLAKTSLRTDLGFRYGREYRFQYYGPIVPPATSRNQGEVDIVAPRAGAAFRYAFSKDVIFTEEVSAALNVVDQTRLLFSSTSKFATHLTQKVALGVSFVLTDDTAPAPGKVSLDTATTIGLEVGF